MANEIRVKRLTEITVQASAAITANAFSGGAQTAVTPSNAAGASALDVYLSVTTPPSTAAGAEVWREASREGTTYSTAEFGLSSPVTIATGAGALYYMGRLWDIQAYEKLKTKAINYGFTAVLYAVPILPEVQ
jgi:hypothetical protein